MSRLINFKNIKDDRGELTFFEIGSTKEISFEVKRIYFLHKSEDLPRGFHAHKNLTQVLFLASGSATVILDDGKNRTEFLLDNPNVGLLIEDMQWREIHNISKDAVILVLASEYYCEEDYIRNYDDFITKIQNNI
jgi:dTDP-4-dehydrorhamnose 3,5-epimerase-like enzyme